MIAEDFQLIDNEKIDNSIIKRDFMEIYHQHGAQVNDENQSIKFFLGGNLTHIQIGSAYLEFEMKVRKVDNTNFIVATDNTNEVNRLVNK